MKKLIALLACIYLTLHLAACTSAESKDESEDSAATESTESVDGELEKVEGAEASQVAGEDANSGFLDEQLPEDALGEKPADTSTAATDAPPADPSAAPPGDELSLDQAPDNFAATDTTSSPPADAMSAPPPLEAPPPIEAPTSDTSTSMAGIDPGGSSPTETISTDDPPKKPVATYQKAKTTPFTQGGQLLNAVYVARPGDSYKTIATMIYGDEKKQKDLKKANPAIKSPKTGDKIYYNSPMRPTDDQRIASYYEDNGMTPETYVAKDGDNLKSVAKELLGFDGAWKEVYALNTVDTKDALSAGTELRYWKSAPAMAPPPVAPPPTEIAQNPPVNEMPPPPPPMDAAPPPPPMAEMPPPPPPEMAPPPPTEAPPQMADMPPPPPPEMAPPPPPTAKKAPPKETLAAEGMDNDMMMALGAAGIILVGLSAIIVMRKRRQQRDMAAAFNDTQVGT